MGVELSFWKLIIFNAMGCWIGPIIVITSNQIQFIDIYTNILKIWISHYDCTYITKFAIFLHPFW